MLRIRISTGINKFLLDSTPVVERPTAAPFLVHQATRLSYVHRGFDALWGEQMGGMWREKRERADLPLIRGDERRAMEAMIDAVVAHEYGLTRHAYFHLLGSFSFSGDPGGRDARAEQYDAVASSGVAAFARRMDPYWDIPLNEALPQPLIDLPFSADPARVPGRQLGLGFGVIENQLPLPGRTPARQVAEAPPADYGAAPLDADAYTRLRRHLDERGVLTSTDAQTLLGVDAASVRPLLGRLVDDGHAVKEGQRRGVRYVRPGRDAE